MEPTTTRHASKAIPEFLSGGGELGQMIREYDWESTPLGAVDTWPHSLRTCVRIILTSRQPIWIGWGKELIKFYNDPYKAIVGGKHPWAMGTPASVVWKDIWHDIEPMLKQVMEKDEGTYVESQLLIMERNGYAEETYYTFSYTPIPGDDGKTAGMFCANTDDTDKIISERQLRTLTTLGKQLADSKTHREVIEKTIATLNDNPYDFPFAIFRSVKNNKALLVSHSALGEAASLVEEEIDLTSDNPIARAISSAVQTGKSVVFDEVPPRKDKLPTGAWQIPPDKTMVLPITQSATKETYGVLVLGANPYRLLDDKYLSFFQLIADQVATSFADVHALEEERKRVQALAEIDRAKTTFFSNISHEFRTPLTLLLSPMEEMLNDPKTVPANKPRVEVAYRNALRMQKLVNTLLEFSRIEAGRMEGRFQKVDICTLTQDLASTFRSAIEKAGMQLSFHCDDIQDEIYVDVEMWERIVLNLVSNAFKYSKEGAINVAVAKRGNEIKMSVTDTGIGIPADQLDKIFDRFHRADNSGGRSQEGTGIGLAMVKELVKLHQGQIEVTSVHGEGSTFTVTIPTGKAHLPEDRISVEPAGHQFRNTAAFVAEANKWLPQENIPEQTDHEHNAAAGKIHTVLLADDNADMRDYVHRLLSDHVFVITAVNGEDAYEKMLQHKPDLLLSDIMMPVLDGFGLLKKVRANPELRKTPVIFLSARAGEEAKVEGLDAGADDYLVKPFSAKELLVRVTNHIRINHVRRQTEQQFYQLFMEAPAIINVFKGPDHRYELFHPKNKEIFGEVDFTGMTLRDAIPGLEEQGIFELLDDVYKNGTTVEQNERAVELTDASGKKTLHYFNFVYQPWRDLKGDIQGVLNYAMDVTETVSSRKKIEESEAYFRKLADTIPAMIWITEKDGSCTYLNKQWYEVTGQTEQEALGFGWLQATHPDDSERAGNIFLEANAQQKPFSILYRLHHKDGNYRWSMDNGSPRFEADGSFAGYIGTVFDVHEEVLATNKIRESEAELRTLAETLPQLVWMTDATGRQLFASSRWQDYTGVDPSPATWHHVVHPQDLPALENAWAESLRDGSFYKIETRLRSKNGDYHWFYGQGEPIKNENGEIIKWIGAFTDIHDQKGIEQKLEQLVHERTQELKRSNEDLQQFAHVASHDLKEPVRKIKTFSNRLETEFGDKLPEKGKVFLNKVQLATERMYSMIDGVLTYSTLNASKQDIQDVNLEQIIADIETDLELTINQKNATLILEGDMPNIQGATLLLYQLFYNLVNNSLKFAREGVPPVISISAEEEQDSVKIILQDNGIGFHQEYADKIFNTFTRLNSKDKYEGTGLGLALCTKIVERHHGTIKAQGQPDKGAIFTIVLPLKQRQTSL